MESNYSEATCENAEEGCYFSLDGIVAFFLPGYKANEKRAKRMDRIKFVFEYEFDPVCKITHGKAVSVKPADIVRLVGNDGTVAFVKEKYFKLFPKGCSFFVAGRVKPILAVIANGTDSKILGIVMPCRIEDEQFFEQTKPQK